MLCTITKDINLPFPLCAVVLVMIMYIYVYVTACVHVLPYIYRYEIQSASSCVRTVCIYINSVLHNHEQMGVLYECRSKFTSCPDASVIPAVETISFNCLVTASTQKHTSLRNDWHWSGALHRWGKYKAGSQETSQSANHKETRSPKLY